MSPDAHEDTICEAAIRALPEILSVLDRGDRPAQDGHVALVVRGFEPAQPPAPVLRTVHWRWRYDSAPEEIDQVAHRAATIDATTRKCIAPVWIFELTPIAADDWYFDYFFTAPLRLWLGEAAGDRAKAQRLAYRARRVSGAWDLEIVDILFAGE